MALALVWCVAGEGGGAGLGIGRVGRAAARYPFVHGVGAQWCCGLPAMRMPARWLPVVVVASTRRVFVFGAGAPGVHVHVRRVFVVNSSAPRSRGGKSRIPLATESLIARDCVLVVLGWVGTVDRGHEVLRRGVVAPPFNRWIGADARSELRSRACRLTMHNVGCELR